MEAHHISFFVEIRNLMFGFGDCESPSNDSIYLVNKILCQQMKSLIIQASESATLRGSAEITHKDVLFLLRKNKPKLKRLLKHLEVKTIRFKLLENLSFGLNAAKSAAETLAEKPVPHRISTLQRCLEFLRDFDETGELSNLLESDIYDEVWVERACRRDQMTSKMSMDDFQLYVAAREQGGFTGWKNLQKFEAWLKSLNETGKSISRMAAELISYLANEIVIQIVDLALLVKRDAMTDQFQRLQPCLVTNKYYPDPHLQHCCQSSSSLEKGDSNSDKDSSLEPKTKKQKTSREHHKCTNCNCIKPHEILEAINRYSQPSGPFCPFSRTSEVQVSRKLLYL